MCKEEKPDSIKMNKGYGAVQPRQKKSQSQVRGRIPQVWESKRCHKLPGGIQSCEMEVSGVRQLQVLIRAPGRDVGEVILR